MNLYIYIYFTFQNIQASDIGAAGFGQREAAGMGMGGGGGGGTAQCSYWVLAADNKVVLLFDRLGLGSCVGKVVSNKERLFE